MSSYLTVRSVRPDMRVAPKALPPEISTYATAPAAGTIKPGELLVSTADRSMWLGVDSGVDPLQAILISDIESLIQTDIDNLAAAKAYADTGLATKAPLNHTHPHTDISDWDAALAASMAGLGGSQFKRGMIMMFHGNPTWIGNNTGGVDLTGWQLCDGTNSSPDLRDRFVIGAHSNVSGTSNTLNPAALKQTTGAGGHNHGGGVEGHKLGEQELPPHVHPYVDSYRYDNYAGHRHVIDDFGSFVATSAGYGNVLTLLRSSGSGKYTRASPAYLTMLSNVTANTAHSHNIFWQADHTHGLPVDAYQAMPWFALAYMMKL
jgi:hypothetical protein